MEHAVIRLKAGEKTPFYEQIYAYFAAAIRSGALAAGEKLPSKRRLARTSGEAVRKIFSVAFGSTRVPMSRPSSSML